MTVSTGGGRERAYIYRMKTSQPSVQAVAEHRVQHGAPPDPARAVEVFYDGACPLCRAEIALYRLAPGGDAIAWRDAAAGCAPPGISREAALARFHVRRADGRLASGFRAFLAVWRGNPRLSRIARALDRAPFVWLGEAGYRGFLLARPLWRRPPRGGTP